MKSFLDAGADKIVLNTTAVLQPDIINQCARAYGRQCVVVAIDVKASSTKQKEKVLSIYINGGRNIVDKDLFIWASEVAERGAGEILLTAMHKDGTGTGFDTHLTQLLSNKVPIQVIASGGAKNEQHFLDAFKHDADACLAAGMFHSGEYSVNKVKKYLARKGVNVRL